MTLLTCLLNKNVNLDPLFGELLTGNKYGDKFNSESNEGINCNIEELGFVIGGDDRDGQYVIKEDEKEEDVDYIDYGWLWK